MSWLQMHGFTSGVSILFICLHVSFVPVPSCYDYNCPAVYLEVWYYEASIIFGKFCCFTYLKGRTVEGVEGKRSAVYWECFSNASNNKGWTVLRPGVHNLIWIFHKVGSDPSTFTSACYLSSKKLELRAEPGFKPRYTGMAYRHLKYYAKHLLDPVPILNIKIKSFKSILWQK